MARNFEERESGFQGGSVESPKPASFVCSQPDFAGTARFIGSRKPGINVLASRCGTGGDLVLAPADDGFDRPFHA